MKSFYTDSYLYEPNEVVPRWAAASAAPWRSPGRVIPGAGIRRLLEVGQLLPPLAGLAWSAPGVVESHQPFEGFPHAARGVEIGRQAGLALEEALVGSKQERLGIR